MRLIFGLSLLFIHSISRSDGLPNFFESSQLPDDVVVSESDLILDIQGYIFDEKRERYIGEDKPIHEDSIFNHNFYQGEGIRIYNNTQYSFDELKTKYTNAQMRQVTFEDLSISLGYGMEFDLKDNQSIGYEYISSFPHDRGQSIRVFWRTHF